VNARVVHKLSVQTPENYLVFQYLNEIAKTYNLEWKAEFAVDPPLPNKAPMNEVSFPEPPAQNISPFQLPSIPNTGINHAPPPYVTNTGFPELPINNDQYNVPIPTFDFNLLPGGGVGSNFASNSSMNQKASGGIFDLENLDKTISSTVTLPRGSTVPNFPSAPDFLSSSSQMPNFPVAPSSNGSHYEFPIPPSSSSSSSSSSTSMSTPSLEFPSPPSPGDKDNTVPDFDELTARFEKLKKRDS